MNAEKAEVYSNNNGFQRRLAEIPWEFLTSLSGEDPPLFDKVLDLGCGTGEVTKNLVNFLAGLERNGGSRRPQYVVGLDSSPEMIAFCRNCAPKAIANADKRNGVVFDFIVGAFDRPFPADWNWLSTFDLVTSHSALHYARDLSIVMENVKSSLRTGGKFLFNFVVESANHFMEAGHRVALKWSSLIPENIFAEFHPISRQLRGDDNSLDPLKRFREFAIDAGLNIHVCKFVRECYVFSDIAELRGTLEPLYPHLRYVPVELKDELMDDLLEEYCRGCLWVVDDGIEKPTWDIEFVVVYGEKP